MSLLILAIGKKHESWIREGVDRYEKRLQKPFDVAWLLLPHSARSDQTAREEESARLIDKIKPDDYVVLLDERGVIYDSPALSNQLIAPLDQSKRVVIIIGGAYGVSPVIEQRVQVIWSLSKLVFPHQLVRLILVEQLYRAQEIVAGRPYHHE